ncbi:MAG: hypothetical protein JWR05_2285 [Mucilaginibacter sp.]|jgi:hypothetical protein|nr:hypothetical protein [Mucilaginibacter sp.]
MSDNQYDNFKSGINRDAKGLAYGLFAGVGLFLFAFTLGGLLIWFFLKTNHYSVAIKSTVGISILVLVVAMLTNRQIGNFVYLCWLKLLLGVVMLICLSFLGFILYCMWYLLKDYF